MDFIERLFGVSPDDGDGSLELLWLGAIALAILAIVGRSRIIGWLAARARPRQD